MADCGLDLRVCGIGRDKVGAHVKTALESPGIPLLAQQVAVEGLAELVRSSTDD